MTLNYIIIEKTDGWVNLFEFEITDVSVTVFLTHLASCPQK